MGGNVGVRKLRKVQYGRYENKAAKPHPVIRIAGQYLEKFGFNIGDVVEVEIADGRIMVRKLAEPEKAYGTEDSEVPRNDRE